MAISITTSSFQADLLPLVQDAYGDEYGKVPMVHDQVFEVVPSDRNYEIDMLVNPFGLVPVKGEGAATEIDFAQQGYLPSYRHLTYGLGFGITQEMIDDGIAYGNAEKFTRMLARNSAVTIETIAMAVLNNAFSSSYTMAGGDGQALNSSSHPVLAGTASNIISTGNADISEAAIEQMVTDIRKYTDTRGVRIGLLPEKLIVAVDNLPTAERILGSPLQSYNAENNINYLRSSGTLSKADIISSPFLTAPNAFWIKTSAPQGLKMFMRKEPKIESSNDFLAKVAQYTVNFRFSVGWSDWKALHGSNGP